MANEETDQEKETAPAVVAGGIYCHFKRNYYLVQQVTLDENLVPVVDYIQLYPPHAYCRRTVANFTEHVDKPEWDNYHGPRFRYIRPAFEGKPRFLT